MALKLLKRSKTYYLRGTIRAVGNDGEKRGVSVYETTGTSDRTLAEAIRVKTEKRILDEIVFGKAKVVTFRQAAEEYVEAGGSQRFLLDVSKKDETESGLVVHFGDTLLGQIAQDDLEKAAREMYPNARPDTLNRQVYTPFIAVWNHAFASEPNMARKWKRPRKAKGTNVVRMQPMRSGNKPVAYDRAATFLAAMSPAPAMLMLTLFYTGMRPIEAFALTADDVDVSGRWLVIRTSKTGEPRGIPMHDVLVPMFESLLKRNTLANDANIFRTPRGEPYGAVQEGGGGLKSAIQGARRRTGIKDISPYTGRHSVSTQLVVNGVHPHIKDQILGHAADDMSRHYTNVPQAPLIAAINTLPVPEAIRALPWWENPLGWTGRLAEGTGRRTDLERKRMANGQS